VNDAFGTAHRAHASTVGVTAHLKPAAAGLLLAREIEVLGQALESPARPFVAILGGAKISGKIDVITHLLPRVDRMLIGGAMMFTFLKAKGLEIGRSLVEDDKLDLAREILGIAGATLVLPTDTRSADADGQAAQVISCRGSDRRRTRRHISRAMTRFAETRSKAPDRLWGGPMSIFSATVRRGTPWPGLAETTAHARPRSSGRRLGSGHQRRTRRRSRTSRPGRLRSSSSRQGIVSRRLVAPAGR
jgi:phosphoglycerate kinase